MAKPKRGTIQVAAAPGALQLRDFGGAAAVVVRCREENAHQNHMEERKLPFMLLSCGVCNIGAHIINLVMQTIQIIFLY